MAAKNRRKTMVHADYVSGSAVKKLQSNQRPEVRRKSHTVFVGKRQERAFSIDLPLVIISTIAAIVMLLLCVKYLQIQSAVTARIKQLETLEKEIENLKAENDALETRINTSVDLDYIYKVATEELGMVYANKNQIRLYNKTESEYVRQYEDIPKE